MCLCVSYMSTVNSRLCENSLCCGRNSRAPDYADVGYLLLFERMNFQEEGLERVHGTADLWKNKTNTLPLSLLLQSRPVCHFR